MMDVPQNSYTSACFSLNYWEFLEVMFDPDIWQWSELTSLGDLPSPRDFAAASAIGNRKIVMWVSKVLYVAFFIK